MTQAMTALPGTWGTVATFECYADAQRAVDHLADSKFPVAQMSIVGSELYLVEQVLGRRTWVRAATVGLLSGTWIGLLVGLLLWIFDPLGRGAATLLTATAAWGAGFGAVLGLLADAIGGGRRGYLSQRQIMPRYFEVAVDPEVVEKARALLTGARR
jgi:hypothetical protein